MLLRYDYILVDLTCLFWVLSMIIIIGSCLIIISTDGHPLGTYGKNMFKPSQRGFSKRALGT
jgi:hypothetical protein